VRSRLIAMFQLVLTPSSCLPVACQAYSNPVVDKSQDRFSFGTPDVDNLLVFCSRYLGWRPEETKQLLDPVMNKIQSGYRQTRLDSFMTYEDGIKFADVRSKRLRDVLKITSNGTSDDAENGRSKRDETNK
jgi:DNA excision repair protein ERCC-5